MLLLLQKPFGKITNNPRRPQAREQTRWSRISVYRTIGPSPHENTPISPYPKAEKCGVLADFSTRRVENSASTAEKRCLSTSHLIGECLLFTSISIFLPARSQDGRKMT